MSANPIFELKQVKTEHIHKPAKCKQMKSVRK